MALATLGLFVFSLPTIPLQDWDEGHAWRHPSQTTVGGSGQPTQFTGKDNDTLTISAIVALRNEKGSYNISLILLFPMVIVALRNEKGSYNTHRTPYPLQQIVALRNEKGSYN